MSVMDWHASSESQTSKVNPLSARQASMLPDVCIRSINKLRGFKAAKTKRPCIHAAKESTSYARIKPPQNTDAVASRFQGESRYSRLASGAAAAEHAKSLLVQVVLVVGVSGQVR